MKIIDEFRKENYEYVNATNEALDIIVSITGCCGENSTSYHEAIWDYNNYWYEGKKGCSVRIYTTRLDIDMIVLGGKGSAQTKHREVWDYTHNFTITGRNLNLDYEIGKIIDRNWTRVEGIRQNRSWDLGRGRWLIEWWIDVRTFHYGDIVNNIKPVEQGQSRSFVTTLRPQESIKADLLDNGANTGYQLSIYSLESNGGLLFDQELLKVFEKPKKATENNTTVQETTNPTKG